MHVDRGRPARRCPTGTRTEAGLRHNVRVGVQYLEAWLRGDGCVPLYNLMEDAATAEISRAQVWQWIRHRAALDDGRPVTAERFRARRSTRRWTRCAARSATRASTRGRFAEAREPLRAALDRRRLRRVPDAPRLRRARSHSPARSPRSAAGARPDACRPTLRADHRRGPDAGPSPTGAGTGSPGPTRRRTSSGCAARCASSTRSRALGAQRLWELLHTEAYVHALGALTGNQAVQKVRAGLKAIYLSRLAGRGRRQHAGADLPGPEPLPGRQRARTSCGASTTRSQRADQIEHAEGEDEPRLVRADRRRRRGRLRRPAQRLRADEGDDRGRRRRRALRGPARLARRSAATWAARCSCRRASSSARSSPRASPPT